MKYPPLIALLFLLSCQKDEELPADLIVVNANILIMNKEIKRYELSIKAVIYFVLDKGDHMSFTFNDIFPVLRAHFPAQNNYYPCSYKEEFEELCHFGVDSIEKLEAIIVKHKEAVMEEDATMEPDEAVYDFFSDEMGKASVDQMLEAGFWFSFPALLRLVLEKEFGEAYDEYALSRDGLLE